MEHMVIWAGFLGAWLLVVGPVYQAALELQEEDVDRERVLEAKNSVPRPEPVSWWWWFLPPVAPVLQRRASSRYRTAVASSVSAEMLAPFVRFGDKAMGWLLVAGGAFLIAVKETWELCELQGWSVAVFWPLIVVMLVAALSYTVHRTRRSAAYTS